MKLLDYASEEVNEEKEVWASKEGKRRKLALEENPRSLSFVTEHPQSEEDSEGGGARDRRRRAR